MKNLSGVNHRAKYIKRSLGIKGDFKPGDLSNRAKQMIGNPTPTKVGVLPSVSPKRKLGILGLI